jgi:hypothetical protein
VQEKREVTRLNWCCTSSVYGSLFKKKARHSSERSLREDLLGHYRRGKRTKYGTTVCPTESKVGGFKEQTGRLKSGTPLVTTWTGGCEAMASVAATSYFRALNFGFGAERLAEPPNCFVLSQSNIEPSCDTVHSRDHRIEELGPPCSPKIALIPKRLSTTSHPFHLHQHESNHRETGSREEQTQR